MKRLLLIGTALLSMAPYAGAMNSGQKDSKINSASEEKIPELSNSIIPSLSPINNNNVPLSPIDKDESDASTSNPINTTLSNDEEVKSQWNHLTDALTRNKNEVKKLLNEFKNIYKDQELDPKPLNNAIQKLFLELENAIAVDISEILKYCDQKKGRTKEEKEQVENKINREKRWRKFHQQFPEILALFVDQDFKYKSIKKEEAIEILNFLFDHVDYRCPTTISSYHHYYGYGIPVLHLDLLYYASSILREEPINDNGNKVSWSDILSMKKFAAHPKIFNKISKFNRTGIAVILPYLEKDFSPMDKETASDLVYELFSVINTTCENPVLQRDRLTIIPNILQSLKKRGFIDLLVCPTNGKTSVINNILKGIELCQKKLFEKDYCNEKFWSEECKDLQAIYRMMSEIIENAGSPEAKKQLDEFSQNIEKRQKVILSTNPKDPSMLKSISNLMINRMQDDIANYPADLIKKNMMTELQDEYKCEGKSLQCILDFINEWIDKKDKNLDFQIIDLREGVIESRRVEIKSIQEKIDKVEKDRLSHNKLIIEILNQIDLSREKPELKDQVNKYKNAINKTEEDNEAIYAYIKDKLWGNLSPDLKGQWEWYDTLIKDDNIQIQRYKMEIEQILNPEIAPLQKEKAKLKDLRDLISKELLELQKKAR